MKKNYLFPNKYRKVGWLLAVPCAILGLYCLFDGEVVFLPSKAIALIGGDTLGGFNFLSVTDNGSWLDEIAVIGLAVSLLFITFSKEKDEDECIANIRMKSLVWAITVNMALLILGTVFFFEFVYLYFVFIYMFSMFILFLLKYHYDLWRFRRAGNEE